MTPGEPHLTEQGEWVCEHGTAIDVHCCTESGFCHSGFLFDVDSCRCGVDSIPSDSCEDPQTECE